MDIEATTGEPTVKVTIEMTATEALCVRNRLVQDVELLPESPGPNAKADIKFKQGLAEKLDSALLAASRRQFGG